jgi:AmmeMemoRadiSam system protein A
MAGPTDGPEGLGLLDLLDLADERGLLLPPLARGALMEALHGEPFAPPDEGWLHRRAATFVTLTQGGTRGVRASGTVPAEPRLRGCIGTVRATRTLVEDLRFNTRAAAFDDPRFPPLTADELESDPVTIAVSVLSPLRRLETASEADLLAVLRPGHEGLLLEWGRLCGTYLPQVWRHFPDPIDFVRSLKRKAGLPDDFWAPDLGIWTFTVRSWSEE